MSETMRRVVLFSETTAWDKRVIFQAMLQLCLMESLRSNLVQISLTFITQILHVHFKINEHFNSTIWTLYLKLISVKLHKEKKTIIHSIHCTQFEYQCFCPLAFANKLEKCHQAHNKMCEKGNSTERNFCLAYNNETLEILINDFKCVNH